MVRRHPLIIPRAVAGIGDWGLLSIVTDHRRARIRIRLLRKRCVTVSERRAG
jgi:hypothetical protein